MPSKSGTESDGSLWNRSSKGDLGGEFGVGVDGVGVGENGVIFHRRHVR